MLIIAHLVKFSQNTGCGSLAFLGFKHLSFAVLSKRPEKQEIERRKVIKIFHILLIGLLSGIGNIYLIACFVIPLNELP